MILRFPSQHEFMDIANSVEVPYFLGKYTEQLIGLDKLLLLAIRVDKHHMLYVFPVVVELLHVLVCFFGYFLEELIELSKTNTIFEQKYHCVV